MYADDTTTLSAGATVELAVGRARRAADALAYWARRWKMEIAGQTSQALLLTQRGTYKREAELKVNGKRVTGGTSLNLLRVTLDRLLHFRDHCDKLRQKVPTKHSQAEANDGKVLGTLRAAIEDGRQWLRPRRLGLRGWSVAAGSISVACSAGRARVPGDGAGGNWLPRVHPQRPASR